MRIPPSDQRTQDANTGRWLHGLRFSWFSVLMLGILILGVLVIGPSIGEVMSQQRTIADLEASNAATREQVDTLSNERERWSDPAYIRAEARQRLLYVMPGETSYLVIDDRAPAADDKKAPISSHIQKTSSNWMDSLFRSVMAAGLSDDLVDSTTTNKK